MAYTLKDGRSLEDPRLVAKLRIIISASPEQSRLDGYPWDECGMATLFAECYSDDTRYCPEQKTWYTYANGAWRKDVGSILVSAKLKEFYLLLTIYRSEIYNESDEKTVEFFKFVSKLGGRSFRERLLKDCADEPQLVINADRFDANPYLINCLNGTYDLKTMSFHEHDWQDLLTMQTNFDYTVRDDVRCDRWERFIDEITQGNKGKALYLQKSLGYSILGTANEECMFILHGKTTRNGKSTLLSAIDYLLGDYATVTPVSIICKADHGVNAEAASPHLAALKGKRFVTMAESDQYGKLDEEVIKQLTGGEKISTRNLYEKPITWLPQFTLWLSCNDLPAVRDKSLFASDRLRVIDFNRHFSPEEQDKNLKTLFQTKDAMQGIFAWLVAGYAAYKRDGLSLPETLKTVVEAYQRENDLVLQFLEDRCQTCDPNEHKYSRIKSLYDAYKIWCKSNGFFQYSSKRFIAELETHPEWHGGKSTQDGHPVYKDIILK